MSREPLESAENKCRDIGRMLKEVMPDGWGFFLCISSYDLDDKPSGFSTYLSTIKRDGAIKLLREMADKLERKEPNI